MTRRLFLALALALVLAAGASVARAGHGPLHGKIVALDPGHREPTDGGCDLGAQNQIDGTTLYEADVNWEVATATKTRLEGAGATVHLTRNNTDCTMTRPDRYALAAQVGAQVLISIHHNGSSDSNVNYTITYYTQRSDQRIASLAQQQLVAQLGFPNNGISRSGFGMTVKPKMPSALTEAWFLTNDVQAANYLSQRNQGFPPGSLRDRESTALKNAICAYFNANC